MKGGLDGEEEVGVIGECVEVVEVLGVVVFDADGDPHAASAEL